MSWYIVDLRCPECGQVHRVLNEHQIPDGPTRPGSLAELHPDGKLPRPVALIFENKVWCPAVKKYVEQPDHAQVFLAPIQSSVQSPTAIQSVPFLSVGWRVMEKRSAV
jgi:hypothetical protein